ncbi:WD40 repeat domain-containing protein [Phototrophicus methaneseepsis]|uniref:WD40 repeat domain-containing protein n=1 Tax=Phototrophicus methaneseepsis TaxID=2710758 RepID=A0A7S8EB24_9CHLR|nr:WD40 repeat domain-containing protein [Phototrophicus methaneseepsis]QPC83676.1 WD40 repeat domain-containing protein [Phototrophicus methaneseepsis]
MAGTLLLSVAAVTAQDSRQPITTDNAGELAQLIRLGRGSAEFASFTPDDGLLVVGGTVGIWLYDPTNLATESEPPVLLSNDETRAIAISPDGTTLAASKFDGDIVLWELASQTSSALIEPSYSTDNMTYSPDGTILALNAGSNGITLYNLAASTELQLEGSFRSEAEVSFSPDGEWLAAAGSDNALYLWNVTNSEEGAKLEGHTNTPISSNFSPDGTVVTGSGDRTIRLWNSADGTEIANISTLEDEQLGRINQVIFSPDGSLFASGDSNGNIVVWDTESQTPLAKMTAQGPVNDLMFSADGTQLLSVSDEQYVYLWDAEDGSEIAAAVGHTNIMNAVTFSPDSSTLAFSDYDENLWLWDTSTMPQLNLATQVAGGGDTSAVNIAGIAYSSDGSVLASVDSFTVKLYGASSHQLLRELEGDGIVEGLAFSPDDTLIAYASSSGLYIFDVETGQLLASLEEHNDWLNSLAWSPDQTLIAASGSDNTVRVYGMP